MDLSKLLKNEHKIDSWPDHNTLQLNSTDVQAYLHPAYHYALQLSTAAQYLMENYSCLEGLSPFDPYLVGNNFGPLSYTAMAEPLRTIGSMHPQSFEHPYSNQFHEEHMVNIRPKDSYQNNGLNWLNTQNLLTPEYIEKTRNYYNFHSCQEESVQIVKMQEPDPIVQPTHSQSIPQKTYSYQRKTSVKMRPVANNVTSGKLSKAERQVKIDLYRQKRKRRIYTKKVSYDCRKKVADQRIRIKGRFVTKTQAMELLQITEDELPIDKIKVLLQQYQCRNSSGQIEVPSYFTNLKLE